ncbi:MULTISPECIES: hypothetical protein [Pseudomonas]|jgi:hypothetical protein|uniref:HrpV n=1 Tax=Pseudomonas syringae pv. ribicola TaxID=55398 RepID=A0A0P9YF09_PSESI|nr:MULTISPECIES: hypothetical protein [Pseudomonas]EKN45184.1 negative regulator of hrp expression HrpV [Pseudomonas viridiflava UASWS0038]KPL66146.1 negative regulator of hrp expression HrpV [Pseudomonas viridiflava]KPY42285.1 hypothetical protein ALO47_200070 [Pseudomonas syringae pv. ribicola]MCD5984172.1 negative regulator of hrp expression HrpV [Pseudomonas sp. CDFA 610]MCQ9472426.1 negative regulator of hrp expression HrpV [Pseudomonas alliivorans]
MTETILRSNDQRDFFVSIGQQRPSTWQWAPGIDFVHRKDSVGWGLSLMIERRAQRPDLFSDALKRRFENIESYDGYYICLDSQQRFVVWHELDPDYRREDALQELVGEFLMLAGFNN